MDLMESNLALFTLSPLLVRKEIGRLCRACLINKISGVSAQPTSQLTFARDDMDAKISVIQYFRERYHINLKFAYLPALQAGSDLKPVYLPMELCKIVEGQRYSKKLNEKQVTALLRATCQRPFERVQSISRMVERNNYNNDKFVNEFGLRVKTELTSIDARVLPAPMLKYQGTQEVPRVGCWNMIDKKMVNGGKVEFWTCVSFSRLRQNKSLISAKHRIEMCHLACRSSEFIMVDPWEASQDIFQRTLTVLCRIKSSLCDSGRISGDEDYM